MTAFYVFNGDADGLCSMVQLHRAGALPDPVIVTGVKRDIDLLRRVDGNDGDIVIALDISLKKNHDHARRILDAGAQLFYVDHHDAGEPITHENLTTVIDTSPEMCTAMLVDDILGGDYRAWAVTAAFGDNFPKLARQRAEGLNLPLEKLERFGWLLNYNGYGASLEDLRFDPAQLFDMLKDFDTPMEALEHRSDIFDRLDTGYKADREIADHGEVLKSTDKTHAVLLPDNAGARRISGVFGNELAQGHTDRAHAILTKMETGYRISVRAPLSNRTGANELCNRFPTGGGRPAAAGVNALPDNMLGAFLDAFEKMYG